MQERHQAQAALGLQHGQQPARRSPAAPRSRGPNSIVATSTRRAVSARSNAVRRLAQVRVGARRRPTARSRRRRSGPDAPSTAGPGRPDRVGRAGQQVRAGQRGLGLALGQMPHGRDHQVVLRGEVVHLRAARHARRVRPRAWSSCPRSRTGPGTQRSRRAAGGASSPSAPPGCGARGPAPRRRRTARGRRRGGVTVFRLTYRHACSSWTGESARKSYHRTVGWSRTGSPGSDPGPARKWTVGRECGVQQLPQHQHVPEARVDLHPAPGQRRGEVQLPGHQRHEVVAADRQPDLGALARLGRHLFERSPCAGSRGTSCPGPGGGG